MAAFYKSLKRLGWPIEQMSDRQITQELYRRWFAFQPRMEVPDEPLSVASATGVFVSMADDGNLDALCWCDGDRIPEEDIVSKEEEALFVREDEPDTFPHAERRQAPREPAREMISWWQPDGCTEAATGWLVDRSDNGIAFIAQADDAPQAGAEIMPTIQSRAEGPVETGPVTVVRTEILNDQLTLVCGHLHDAPVP